MILKVFIMANIVTKIYIPLSSFFHKNILIVGKFITKICSPLLQYSSIIQIPLVLTKGMFITIIVVFMVFMFCVILMGERHRHHHCDSNNDLDVYSDLDDNSHSWGILPDEDWFKYDSDF